MENIIIRSAEEFKKGEVGLYAGVPEEAYHAFPAASNSRLSKMKVSPRHCQIAIEEGFTPTKSTDFGGASHALVLQPMEFLKRYAVASQCSGETKAKARCSKGGQVRIGGKWFCSIHAPEGEADDVSSMSEDDFERIQAMSREIQRHPVTKEILAQAGGFEITLLWYHEGADVMVKNRIDFLTLATRFMMDYKTTADASLWGFAKSIWTWGYHRQGYLYRKGGEAVGIPDFDFVFVAQEKKKPFALMPYQLSAAAIEAGRIEVEEEYVDGLGERVSEGLIYRYAECMRSGRWPGWKEDGAVFIDLPDYAYREIFEEAV